jgi:hypothetical protein
MTKETEDKVTDEIKELENKRNNLAQNTNSLKSKVEELEKRSKELEQKLHQKEYTTRELEQEKVILDRISESLGKKAGQLEQSSKETEKRLQEVSFKSSEVQQEKVIMEKMMNVDKAKKHAMQRKLYISIAIAAIAITVVTAGFFTYESQKNEETEKALYSALKLKDPLIQNLKGEVVKTWISWNKPTGDTLYVTINAPDGVAQDKLNAVKDAILSTGSVDISNSKYFKGWEGALEQASSPATAMYVPVKIDVEVSHDDKGDIVIKLLNGKNDEGYAGFTKSVTDQNHILKSTITIYDVDTMSAKELSAVIRHEFGHALGLAHATDPNDLMHATIETQNPLISKCDTDTVHELYDNKQNTSVECAT